MKNRSLLLLSVPLFIACGSPATPSTLTPPAPAPSPTPSPTPTLALTTSTGTPLTVTASAGGQALTQNVRFTALNGFSGPVSLSIVDGDGPSAKAMPGFTVTTNGASGLFLHGDQPMTPTLTLSVTNAVIQTGDAPITAYLQAAAGGRTQAIPINVTVRGFTVNTTDDTSKAGDDSNVCVDFLGHCSLRAAAETAALLQHSDDLVITIPAGTYTFASSAAFPIRLVSLGGGTVTLQGAGADTTVINANQAAQALRFLGYPSGSGKLAMDGLSVRNATGSTSSGLLVSGAGIDNEGILSISHSIISGNINGGYYGGGIHNSGTLTLNDVTIRGNSAIAGGGIYNLGVLRLTSSAITGNVATGGPGADSNLGGGIENTGAVTASDLTVSGNSATWGGGIYNTDGASFALDGATLTHNTARNGGGVANAGTLTARNITVFQNNGDWTTGDGGGIYSAKTLSLSFSTISGNSAGIAGGLALNSGYGTATLKGVIISDNVGQSAPDCAGGFTSAGYNLILKGSDCGRTGAITTDVTGIDPVLATLLDNGGSTWTMRPGASSAVIDAIPSASCTDVAGVPVTTDQRGVARPHGTGCDIGAVEQ